MKKYITADMQVSAILSACGLSLADVKMKDLCVIFHFNDDQERADKIVQQYLNKNLTVNITEYIMAYRNLKSYISNLKRNNEQITYNQGRT